LIVHAACGDGDGGAPDAMPLPTCAHAPAGAGDPVTSVLVWERTTLGQGFPQGSVALCDLEGDGQWELIVPNSLIEPLPGTMLALDAQSGDMRWESNPGPANYGYPFCLDVDRDGVDDVVATGHSGDAVAHSGQTGAPVSQLTAVGTELGAGNTYSIAGEVGGTGLHFVSKGGGGNGSDVPDVPGRVMAVAGTGAVLRVWEEPYGAEIYSSPAVLRSSGGEMLVAIGTGGERRGGHVHVLTFDEPTATFALRWSVPSSCGTGGFVSSPVFGRLGADGGDSVVAMDYCGTVHAVGIDGALHWSHKADIPFGTANPLLADLDGDGALDVIAAFESVNFSDPATTSERARSQVLALDGRTGERRWSFEADAWVFASPVSADFDSDGVEDALVAFASPFFETTSALRVLSGASGTVLYEDATGNTSGTPVLGDVDDDGNLDVFLTTMADEERNARVVRIEFCGRPFVGEASESGFRGWPAHDGAR
jgi:outer membrane protein assembly factor BamB